MYSEKKSIRQLVALLKAYGIRKMVLCPGSRNAPLVHTLAEVPDFQCFPVTDERSAGFFALGMAVQQQEPVVVCCTSGTALLNLHPAVCEAYYQQVPLIIVSADRPAAWIGQMDGQTLPQPGVFGSLVRKSVSLPEIRTAEDEWYANRLIQEALFEVNHHVAGPVHINIPISEPLFQYDVSEWPVVRTLQRCTGRDAAGLRATWNNSSRCLIVCGQMSPREAAAVQPFLDACGAVVFSEHLSNLDLAGQAQSRFFDAALYLLSQEEEQAWAPDLLITLGGHIVSKRLKKFLRRCPPKQHWQVAPDGQITDLFCCLTHVLEMTPGDLAHILSEPSPSAVYRQQWQGLLQKVSLPEVSYSSLQAVGCLIRQLPACSVLHLANSSAVRAAALFPLPSGVRVTCNRGTSGIEGSLSAAVGYAALSAELNFMIIGDLSFFYDMNALWNTSLGKNLRILLLNNQGGGIFYTLPGLQMESSEVRFVGAAHKSQAQGWAESCGFMYYRATDEESLSQGIHQLLYEKSPKPVLLEVFTDIRQDAAVYKAYFHSLKNKH